MTRTLKSDAAAYSFSLVLNRLPGFLFLPLIAHQMDPRTMGVWITALMVSELLQMVCGLGLRPAFFRFFPASKNAERMPLLTNALTGSALGGVAGGTLLWLFVLSGEWLSFPPLFIGLTPELALWVAVASWLNGIASIFMLYYKAEQRAGTFLKITLLAFLWECAFVWGLYRSNLLAPSSLMILEASKQAVLGLFGGYGCRKEWQLGLDRPTFRKLFAYGIWLMPAAFFTSVIFFSDRFWLGHSADLETVGIYGVYYRLAMPLGILFSGYIASLDSHLFRMDAPEAETFLPKALSKFVIWGGCAALGVSWLGPLVLQLLSSRLQLLPPAYSQGLHYFPLFAATLYAFYFSDHFGSALEFAYRAKARIAALSLCALLHFVWTWAGLSMARAHAWDAGAIAIGLTFMSFLVLAGWQARVGTLAISNKTLLLFSGICAGCLGAAWVFAR